MSIFRRRRQRADAEFDAAVRRSLDRHAADAPTDDFFTERVLAAVEREQLDHDAEHTPLTRRRRRVWLPVVAAAAVLAVLAGVELAVDDLGDTNGHDHPAVSRTTDAPAPTVSTNTAPVGPTAAPTSPHGGGQHPTTSARSGPPQLSGVRIVDLTFSSTTNGWALASADCLSGSGRCTALLHTTDAHTWSSSTNPGVDVNGITGGCPAARCATNIRFATDRIGYIYGPDVLFLTTDGGASWQRQSGGAIALESADGNSVRVTSSGSGCPGPCDIAVQTAPNGSSTWTDRSIGALPNRAIAGAQLTRNGPDVYLLVTGNPAGGADDARSTLYRSPDDGRTWSKVGEPCPQSNGETDTVSLTAGADSNVAALCAVRGTSTQYVAVSRNGGQRFVRVATTLPAAAGARLVGDPSATLLVTGTAANDRAYRSSGGGAWRSVAQLDGAVDFAGFESTGVGRAVTDNGRHILTTQDAGLNWTVLRLP